MEKCVCSFSPGHDGGREKDFQARVQVTSSISLWTTWLGLCGESRTRWLPEKVSSGWHNQPHQSV